MEGSSEVIKKFSPILFVWFDDREARKCLAAAKSYATSGLFIFIAG